MVKYLAVTLLSLVVGFCVEEGGILIVNTYMLILTIALIITILLLCYFKLNFVCWSN